MRIATNSLMRRLALFSLLAAAAPAGAAPAPLQAAPASPSGARLPSNALPATPAEARAGFEEIRIPNGDEPPLVGGVWYPTTTLPSDQTLDGNVQRVAPGAPVAGQGLPLVVISHGGGGSYTGHYDTALALAKAGFVVAAVTHAGDSSDDQSRVLEQWRRPGQLSRLIDYVLGGWRGHGSVDAKRIGAFGFSNGGFTMFVMAGGVPDLAKIDPYCVAHPQHDLCSALAGAGIKSVAAMQPPPGAWKPDPRIRAIAAGAPAFGFAFNRAGLEKVTIPVLLWRPADDTHQPNPWYEEAIRAALPRPPIYRVEASAGHYAFLPVCNDQLRKIVPQICVDLPGFDRAAFHTRLNAELVRFFKASLSAG
jgi:predicted dienelactone hydrolase